MKKRFFSMFAVLALSMGLFPSGAAAYTPKPVPMEEEIAAYPVNGGYIYFDMANGTVVNADSSVISADIPAYIGEEKVVAVGDSAFYYCSDMVDLILPVGVEKIGESAFYDCKSLTNLVLYNDELQIGNAAFYDCSGLKELTINGDKIVIDEAAFYACTNLENLYINAEELTIGEAAFYACEGLKELNITAGIARIGNAAFYDCKDLSRIYISGENSVEIGDGAFYSCTGPSDIKIEGQDVFVADGAFYSLEGDVPIPIPPIPGPIPEPKPEPIPDPIPPGNEDETEIIPKAAADVEKTVKVVINGKEMESDQSPVIVQDRVLVPLRAIFEALGARVDWNSKEKTVTSTKDENTVSLVIGDNRLYRNGEEKPIDVPARIINSRTMVPARAVSEAYGCKVAWSKETKTVSITE